MLKYNALDICVHQLYGVPVYVKRITVSYWLIIKEL